MKYFFLVFFFSLVTASAFSQINQAQLLSVKFVYGNDAFSIDEATGITEAQTRAQFQVLKFYIHAIAFYENEKLVWKENLEYHLIDASQTESLQIRLTKPIDVSFTKLKFKLGVDSLTNVSGVMGGDLDPTKGMYWTWQSGYINFKLEGKSAACLNPKKEFQFHVGGYQAPYATLRTVVIETTQLELVFDVKHFMDQIDLSQKDHLMLPGAEAARLSEIVGQSFHR